MQSGRLADRPFMLGKCLHTGPLTDPMWVQPGRGLHHSCLGYRIGAPQGGGVLGLEKGTNCSLTTVKRWLSKPKMVKKGGCSFIILHYRGAV